MASRTICIAAGDSGGGTGPDGRGSVVTLPAHAFAGPHIRPILRRETQSSPRWASIAPGIGSGPVVAATPARRGAWTPTPSHLRGSAVHRGANGRSKSAGAEIFKFDI